MASFFTGDALTRMNKMTGDRQYMSDMFSAWRDKEERWKEMLLPQVPTDKQATNYSNQTITRLSKAITGSDQPYRAYVRSSFVHSGSTSILNRMIRSEIVIETSMNAQSDADLERSDLFEDFNQGIISVLDYNHARTGEGTGFIRSRFESIVNHGKAVTFVHMRNEGGVAVPYAQGYDPFSCYHTFGGAFRRFGRDVPMPADEVERIIEELRAMYGTSIEMPMIVADAQKEKRALVMSDYWLEERVVGADGEGPRFDVWRGLMLDEKPVCLYVTDFRRMPIILTSINSVSSAYKQTQAMTHGEGKGGANNVISIDTIENHAEPWFAPAENALGELDTLMSLELEAIHMMTMPPIEVHDESGRVTGWVLGRLAHTPGAVIHSSHGQAIRALDMVKSAAAEVRHMKEHLQQELEYLLPPQVRGQAPFAGASGYLQNQMTDAQKNALVDVFAGGSLHIKGILQELDQQFHDDGKMKIRLDARVRMGLNVGAHYARDFTVKDFPESAADFTVIIDPMTGENDAAAMQIATNGITAGLIDDLQAMQMIKVRHPLQMRRRIEAMRAEASPIMQEIKQKARLRDDISELGLRVERARRNGRDDDADAMELMQADYISALRRLESVGMPNQGTPPAPGGFSPDVVPPQETTANPQIAAAAKGQPSVGMAGQGGRG